MVVETPRPSPGRGRRGQSPWEPVDGTSGCGRGGPADDLGDHRDSRRGRDRTGREPRGATAPRGGPARARHGPRPGGRGRPGRHRRRAGGRGPGPPGDARCGSRRRHCRRRDGQRGRPHPSRRQRRGGRRRLRRAGPARRMLRRRPVRARERAGDRAGRRGAGRPYEAAHRAAARGVRHVLDVAADAPVHRGVAGDGRQRAAAAGRGAADTGPGVPDPPPVPPAHRRHDRPARRDGRARPAVGAAGVPLGARRGTGARGGGPGGHGLRGGRPRRPRVPLLDRRRRDLRAGARPPRARGQPARCGVRRPPACVHARRAVPGGCDGTEPADRHLTDRLGHPEAARRLGLGPLRTVEEILREKAAMPVR